MNQKEELNPDIENRQDKTENITEENKEQQTDPTADLEGELAAAKDKYVRLYSDFENYKKRNLKDKLEQSRMAAADVLLSLLPIIDDLERALKSLEGDAPGTNGRD